MGYPRDQEWGVSVAQKRMFSQSIVLSDDFLDMPASTRCLYFCFGMLADDDGFVNNPKSVMRQCGSTNDDFGLLLSKGYVYLFKTGVVVIMHWRINNYLRKDRYTPTKYIDEKAQLLEAENGAYSFASGLPLGIPNGLPTGRQVVYTDKNSIDKDSKEGADKPPRARFVPPTVEEVRAYCDEKGFSIDPQMFVAYYDANGWVQGKGRPLKNWKAAVLTWDRRDKSNGEERKIDNVAEKIVF